MAFWSRVTALIGGGAVATAASDGVRPVLEPVRQHAWSRNKLRVLDVDTAARLVAQGIVAESEAADEAARNGYGTNRLEALIKLAQTMPGQADLDRMLNREKINRALFNEALAKHQVDPRFWDALYDLTNDKLSVADVAAAVQQGHLPNEGILPDVSAAVKPAQGSVIPQAPDQQPPSHVPLTQVDIDPITEAAADGFDLPRLKVRANLAGLPPGADTLLQMWNRGLIDEESVDAGIREGHLKTKWAGAFKRMRWAVLSASEYANLHIRGWITTDEMYKGGALTGHTTDQMNLLYLNRGRPLAPQQAATAWARDAPHPVGPGYPTRPGTFDEEDFLRALKQSDVRTEYGPILWHNRFAYPSLFQLNRLVLAGAISPDVGAEWAAKDRYAPEVIAALVTFWTAGSPTKADAHVAKAETQLWSTTHSSYKAEESTAADVAPALTLLGLDAATQTEVLARWDAERALIRKQLSPGQIKKALKSGVANPATGVPWTFQEGVDALLARGYDLADATVLLQE